MLKVDFNRVNFERLRSAVNLLEITKGDLAGPVLTRVAQVHRAQEARIFVTEGAEGGTGAWPPLSPEYARRKARAAAGGRAAAKGIKGKARSLFLRSVKSPISQKILVWSGDMRDRFLKHSRAENVEEFQPRGPNGGVFLLGARSEIAGYHFTGTRTMPRRDPITKTRAQVLEILQAVVDWYRQERIPQAQRAAAAFRGRR